MICRASVIVLVLALAPAVARAQDAALTVSVPSADVHKGPSTVTPVVGRASRGAVLPVSRNLGSWVSVEWPDAQDGIGYVHVTMGRLGPANGDPLMAARAASAASAPPPAPAGTPAPPICTPADNSVVPRRQVNIAPASRIFGVGGLVASTTNVGASVRAWGSNRLGIQVGLTRDAATSAAGDRLTSIHFEPGVVWAPLDRVGDYIWLRPYVGSVVSFRRQTLRATSALGAESASDGTVGLRVFGGGELTFASAPRFGLSADVGYRRFNGSFAGFETDRLSASVAGHWYIK
jgi:hypothetical protein